MAHVYDKIDESLTAWIREQPMWFVATAPLAAGGQVNRSPRGHDSFSILGARRVGWVDYTGSGIETIAHLRENGRVCLMFASFGPRPRIVRLHGTGMVHLPGTSAFAEVAAQHPEHPSTRAVVTVELTRISDACGWGVPVMEAVGERDLLLPYVQKKGRDGMAEYRAEHNAVSIDELPGYPSE
ncbi:pyridoxamine 5'-phosphate oxidase family protein [Rathayibacter rathayi]|uniref:pyridoxamine 5'-phosphate oxidase family protein n=1 Tax=Rathayibacter rathayi TaxID=33887 RepID=UPI000CE82FCD|nr:pyridoxamine 5'-phosphate oxidase family protein [Rathayibacter rathayi]PPG67031.1 pyridoxamine 5'-phosphate oxidase [Rathayibacter rathayi]PPG75358.1 pyridoxamine 5'-phosphate oxidase [Rathayibacter rathayi]PPI76364.1 pyridoxamine 5'-phosphate oxidase [Rathayibacter rathayi]